MPLYRESERRIRRSIHLLSAVSLIVVAASWTWIFLRDAYVRFESDRRTMTEEYLTKQREILKERVDVVSDFIVTYRRQAEAHLMDTVRERVDRAHNLATSIIAANAGHAPEPEIQRQVVEALRPMRWENGRSYIWINGYDLRIVLWPTEPAQEGSSLAGVETVHRQAEIARTRGAGFSRDSFPEPGASEFRPSPQISYVRDLGHWNWYLGSAIFVTEFEEAIQDELLEVIAQFRYDDGNYIFIDTYDGYALLMNGERLDPPQYMWELESPDGVKVLQEQLRVATSSPEGGFLSYTWHEPSRGEDMEYLSYVRMVDDWGWKIGTGSYLETIEDEIERRRVALWNQTWRSVQLGALVAVAVFSVVVLASVAVNRRIAGVLASMRASLDESQARLRALNTNLERRVRDETERRLRLHRLSITDPLTGLFNRRHMEDVLEVEWRRAARAGRPISLIMLDVDRFKAYNDSLGHPAGDFALVRVADVMKQSLRRAGDVAARYGGEEFAVVLPEAGPDQARAVAEMIQKGIRALELPHPASDIGPWITTSIGVGTIVPTQGVDPADFVEFVDRALYAAKRKGGDRIEQVVGPGAGLKGTGAQSESSAPESGAETDSSSPESTDS